jgi:hypothetical protein
MFIVFWYSNLLLEDGDILILLLDFAIEEGDNLLYFWFVGVRYIVFLFLMLLFNVLQLLVLVLAKFSYFVSLLFLQWWVGVVDGIDWRWRCLLIVGFDGVHSEVSSDTLEFNVVVSEFWFESLDGVEDCRGWGFHWIVKINVIIMEMGSWLLWEVRTVMVWLMPIQMIGWSGEGKAEPGRRLR